MSSWSFALVHMIRHFNEKVGNGGVTSTEAYNPYFIFFLIRVPMFAQNMMSIVGSIANIIWGGGGRERNPHEKRENLNFDNE